MATQSSQENIGRISGLDLARACAVCGMILENYVDTMVPNYAAENPAWLAWLMSMLEGRSAPVFVILAGIGISLMIQRARSSADDTLMRFSRRKIRKRALFLFGVGFLHSLIWDPDILHFFAVYMLIASFFLSTSNLMFMLAAMISTLIFPLLYIFLDYSTGWDFATLTYMDLWSLTGTVRHIFFNGFHAVFPWMAFFFIGMWLGRGVLFDPAKRILILTGALTIMVAVEITSAVAEYFFLGTRASDIEAFSDFFSSEILPPMPLYILTAGASAIVVIVLSLSIYERLNQKISLRPLVTIGRMSLSIYLAHTLIGLMVLAAVGRLEHQTMLFAVGYSLFFIALLIVFAGIWRLKWRHGPIEALMRRLT